LLQAAAAVGQKVTAQQQAAVLVVTELAQVSLLL
jgi:hypothetical protein